MKFYYAPMEGVVGYNYRNAHHTFFKHIDRYYAPFIVADQNSGFTKKDRDDLLPENNKGLVLIPQILTNNAKDYIHTAKKIHHLGYNEINLNLGCPSLKVVSRNRGSGFLIKKEALHAFLEEIFENPITEISVKTRVGKYEHEEIYELMEIFNKYPIKELTIHPRVQTDIYKNKPNLSIFSEALEMSKNPVCYNGDIFTALDYLDFKAAFPNVESVMLGRGLLTNPGLVEHIKYNKKLDKSTLRSFHNLLYNEYKKEISEERNVLSKMKEIWFHLIQMFSNDKAYLKLVMRAGNLNDFEHAIERLFNEQEILEDKGYSK